ncbi:MAG: hypothetical protein KDA64_08930 [Rhodospirillaceae bacterium]|nr:hypothetical protein [Rhodospirillaceae bacterium]
MNKQATFVNDLFEEFCVAREDLSEVEGAALVGRYGIPAARVDGALGAASIATTEAFWTPEPGGRRAVVCPVIEAGALVDLVAFRPSAPAKWWLRTGAAEVLGGDGLWHARIYGEPVRVMGNPLAWLRADHPLDVCLLASDANLIGLLGGVVQATADTPATARWLTQRWQAAMPRLNIAVDTGRAAA